MAERRPPFVAVRTDIRKEERVEVIADIAGCSWHEALGRLVDLWAWCTDRGLKDAPDDSDGYAVSDAVVRRFFGDRGVDALLGEGVDEFAMGERRPDGLIYLRGTSETVAALRRLHYTARAGGEAAHAALGRDTGGRFVRKTTITPADGPAGIQPDSSLTPAGTSVVPDPDPDPDPELSLPRAIAPSTDGSRKPVPQTAETTRPRETQQGAATPGKGATAQGAAQAAGNVAEPQLGPVTIARAERPLPPVVGGDRGPKPENQIPPGESAWHRRMRWWAAMLEADQRIRAEGIEPNAPALPKNPAGENESNMNRCERQLVDGGATPDEVDAKMRHIVLVAETEAIAKRTRKFFLPALIWDPKRAIRSADTSLADAASTRAQARAGPRAVSSGRFEPPPPSAFRRGIVKI